MRQFDGAAGSQAVSNLRLLLQVYLTTRNSYGLDSQAHRKPQSWMAMASHLHSIDPRLAKALSNEVRARALRHLARSAGSPKTIAAELGLDVRNVAYHVRVLKELGCVELVRTVPRRGAVEHVYRAADWVVET
jgi:DNA-binding transcriptional ArsR family regulator